MSKTIRFLMAKPGLDGHEVGARFIARVLRDAGMEVIYLGTRKTPEMIVNSALQEDVDVIGLSILSGIHKEASLSVIQLLQVKGAGHISVVVGGIIPYEDINELKEIGVKAVFGPGTNTGEIIRVIKELVDDGLA